MEREIVTEMKKIILKHVNLVDEAIYFLYQMANTTSIDENLQSYRGCFPKTLEQYDKKCEKLSKLYQKVKEETRLSKDKVEYYFKERTGFMTTYGALALIYERANYENSLEKLTTNLKHATIEQRVKIYADTIWSEGAGQLSDSALVTFEDLIDFLEKSPMSSEERWEVVKIFNNQEKYFNEALRMIEVVISIFKKYQAEIDEMEESFSDTWKNYFEEDKFIQLIQTQLSVKWDISKDGYVIVPTIFLFLTLMISLKDRLQNRDVIRVGILFDHKINFGKQGIDSERINKFGKVISDKSKVEILKFINKKPAYGKEIAEALKLSTPTISHHVNALLELGLVKTSVEANKIFYSMNREVVENILDEIKQYLLIKDNKK